MIQIALVRHGETDWNRTGRMQGRADIPINETGAIQMEACGIALRGGRWQAVITSPLSRAVRSGEILAGILGVPLYSPEEELVERDYGEATGLTQEERQGRYPSGECPGLENQKLMGERMLRCLLRLAKHSEEKAPGGLVIVSHGSAIHALLTISHTAAIPAPAKNGAVTLLRYENHTLAIEQMNLTPCQAERYLMKCERSGEGGGSVGDYC